MFLVYILILILIVDVVIILPFFWLFSFSVARMKGRRGCLLRGRLKLSARVLHSHRPAACDSRDAAELGREVHIFLCLPVEKAQYSTTTVLGVVYGG